MEKVEKIILSKTYNDIFLRKCVECGKIFESNSITCPNCGSKKTTVSFEETESN